MGIAPTESLKLRQQEQRAKRVRFRCPFSWRLFGLEVEEELSSGSGIDAQKDKGRLD